MNDFLHMQSKTESVAPAQRRALPPTGSSAVAVPDTLLLSRSAEKQTLDDADLVDGFVGKAGAQENVFVLVFFFLSSSTVSVTGVYRRHKV